MTSNIPSLPNFGRKSSVNSSTHATPRPHGRVTKEDIRSAGLRRWDGRARITQDWLNLYQVCRISVCLSAHPLILRRNPSSAFPMVICLSTCDIRVNQAEVQPFASTPNPSGIADLRSCLNSVPHDLFFTRQAHVFYRLVQVAANMPH